MKTEHDILVAARELISDPGRWTQGVSARNAIGRGVFPNSSDAVCWCAYGAIGHVYREYDANLLDAENALTTASRDLFSRDVALVNDHLGHAAILEVFDHAIAKAAASDGDAA